MEKSLTVKGLDSDLLQRMKAASAMQGKTIAEFVRDAISAALPAAFRQNGKTAVR